MNRTEVAAAGPVSMSPTRTLGQGMGRPVTKRVSHLDPSFDTVFYELGDRRPMGRDIVPLKALRVIYVGFALPYAFGAISIVPNGKVFHA